MESLRAALGGSTNADSSAAFPSTAPFALAADSGCERDANRCTRKPAVWLARSSVCGNHRSNGDASRQIHTNSTVRRTAHGKTSSITVRKSDRHNARVPSSRGVCGVASSRASSMLISGVTPTPPATSTTHEGRSGSTSGRPSGASIYKDASELERMTTAARTMTVSGCEFSTRRDSACVHVCSPMS